MPLIKQLKKAKIAQITEIQTIKTHHFRCPFRSFEINMARWRCVTWPSINPAAGLIDACFLGAKFKMAVRTEDFSNVEQQIDGISGEKYREIGDQAVWSLSSCKPGFGVDQLRDGNLDTYWQSDGPQPHLISVQFRRKTAIQNICLYADYKLDESYTPSKISIRAGNHFHDLHQIELIELEEPNGWLTVSLSDGDKPLRTYMLQVAVLANHQNGRDTHMRQIKIHAPSTDTGTYKMPTFTSVECAMYSTIK